MPAFLMALAVAAFLCSALFQTAFCLQRTLAAWETSARLRTSLSAALFLMSREIRMAGCNPLEEVAFPGASVPPGGTGSGEEIELRMDRRGASVGTPPDGDIQDPGEIVAYRWDEKGRVLRRNGQPLAAPILAAPPGGGLFHLTKEASHGLLRVWVASRIRDRSLALSAAVRIRNRLS